MKSSSSNLPLVIVAGPTASGKTALGLALAAAFQGAIVNFDSMQLYRGFDLGTAKPTAEEQRRAPHHLFSVVAPDQPMTAGAYARLARPLIRGLATAGRLAILVGGTGFYLRALLEGLFPGPAADPELRARLRRLAARWGAAGLHRILRRLDPESAARIAPADTSKIVRALELRLLTGRSRGELWRQQSNDPFPGFVPLALGLNPARAELYRRIDERAAVMFSGGIQAETRALLERYPASLWPFQAHGYKQACDLLLRAADPALALAEAQQEQRRYAKRQLTWFRHQADLHWLEGFGDDAAIQARAVAWVHARLHAWPS